MTQSIAILGRQPALGLAELESLFGEETLTPLSGAALLSVDPSEVAFERLGGTLKLAKHLTTLNTTDWAAIMKYLTTTLPQHIPYIPPGKIRFGLSVYGLPIKSATLNRSGLEIKKVIKNQGRSVRVVPNTEPVLSTAQTLHNQLAGPTGLELILVRQGKQTLLGQVTHVQDINAYAARDQRRPMRDAKVGMLPPKLAQIIINLAMGRIDSSLPRVRDLEKIVLDPFCGTGVVLQEALLMGYRAYGTDLEPRMVEYSQKNLDWLREKFGVRSSEFGVQAGDATNYQWSDFDCIAAETYLGRPFSAQPDAAVLREVIQDVDTIHRKFLQNLTNQTEPGFRLCIAIPAWPTSKPSAISHQPSAFWHLKMLDSLEELGYTRWSFKHVSHDQLVYHRPGQIVARELVVLQRTDSH